MYILYNPNAAACFCAFNLNEKLRFIIYLMVIRLYLRSAIDEFFVLSLSDANIADKLNG